MTTEKIAKFIVKTSYDQIPREVVRVAKETILDCLGVALAGSVEPVSQIVTAHVREAGGNAEAGVIAGGFRTSCSQAALVNGTLSHALDYDCGSGNIQHPAAVGLPVVLALGERDKVSGQRALEAYILGWEVGARINAQISTALHELGWHSTGIVGPIAAAIAAAKMLNLSEQQTRMALGIAASQTGGLRVNFGTHTKPLHAGNAARSGVVAAQLAEKGFTADEKILEGSLGLSHVLLGRELNLAELSAALGSPFDIIEPGVEIKPYPSCGNTHKSITAMLQLIEEHSIHAEDVAEVECRVSPYVSKMLIHTRPRTGMQGRFSMQYCMAAAILDGEVTLKQFTDEKVLAPEAQALIPRVKFAYIEENGKPSHLPQIVTVRLRDGRAYTHQVPFRKGSPGNPMTSKELESKFRNCAQRVLSPGDIERTLKLVSNLETLEDISELMQLVT